MSLARLYEDKSGKKIATSSAKMDDFSRDTTDALPTLKPLFIKNLNKIEIEEIKAIKLML